MARGGQCRVSGKTKYRTLDAAARGASWMARMAIGERRIESNLYAYICEHCDRWHITHRSTWDGRINHQVHHAPPEVVQRWMMPKEWR